MIRKVTEPSKGTGTEDREEPENDRGDGEGDTVGPDGKPLVQCSGTKHADKSEDNKKECRKAPASGNNSGKNSHQIPPSLKLHGNAKHNESCKDTPRCQEGKKRTNTCQQRQETSPSPKYVETEYEDVVGKVEVKPHQKRCYSGSYEPLYITASEDGDDDTMADSSDNEEEFITVRHKKKSGKDPMVLS